MIGLSRKLPEDYAIDALSLEAERRSKVLGRPYSYGQLVADTTIAQRKEIVEEYRRGAGCKKDRTAELYIPVNDNEDLKKIRKKTLEEHDETEKAGE